MIVDFEHIDADRPPHGYDGFNFSNVGVVVAATEPTGSGYQNVLSSGEAVAFNGYEDRGVISAHSSFSFFGGEFAAAWNNDLKVTIKGYRDGELVARHVYLLDPDHTHIEIGDLKHIDHLVISSKGGVDADPDDGVSGVQVAMDNLNLKFDDQPVPALLNYDAAAVEAHAMGELGAAFTSLVV